MSRSNNSTKKIFKYDGTQPVPRDVEHVEVLPCVKIIPDHAFEGCRRLKSVIFHEGLEKIGKWAFSGCQSLEGITFPSTLNEIGDCAFWGCRGLREVLLNEGLKKIGACAFCIYCSSLEGITFPSTLIEIGDEAFHDCHGLREVVLNKGLEKIGRRPFENCPSLGSLKFPSIPTQLGMIKCESDRADILNEIGDEAFHDCHGLREVVLNKGLEKIGRRPFENCPSLGSLKFPSIPTQLGMIECESDRADILNTIDETADVSMVDGEVLISGTPLEGGNGWMTCKENLDRILDLIAHVQMKEATAVFELSLWKGKMAEESVVGDGNRNREDCCIGIPGPVKDAVMQFFPPKQLNQSAEQPDSNQSEEHPDSDVSDNDYSSYYSDSDGDY
eukprot:CAMPEP_0183784930 /NCGR_PEP_ID=MMETSP0739-20130205/66243_1 /TAXON_ID=385413 /ORGANISM="Thalassiosira miniscula, Strain CCMP1093" /LENGTH=387 /DNA_ID=CAMNT_0026028921 /DNA_START=122 /DNA_END=1285 /DNA_ORIENTATION=+